MDFDEINPAGIVFAVLAFIVGLIVSRSMDANLFWKLASGFVCGIAGYFIGGKIADG